MIQASLAKKINGSDLFAVPAVHFHYAFAQEVNRLSRHPDTKPDAMVVELGPNTAAAAKNFILELFDTRANKTNLPLLLGMFKSEIRRQQKRLRFFYEFTKYESQNKFLERESRSDKRSLSLLPLSPTDSIIEAIRCAIELDIPVYGVDVEDIGTPKYGHAMIQDPAIAAGNVEKYVETHLKFAEAGRDDAIDDMREKAMASRLKAILKTHSRVLFTCGLAHWRRIQCHLADLDILADHSVENDIDPEFFCRVIVHPVLAIRYLDKYPKAAEAYESTRSPAHQQSRRTPKALPHRQMFSDTFNRVCTRYFTQNSSWQTNEAKHRDLFACAKLKQYMLNLCIVNQLIGPDMRTSLKAAGSVMSASFCEALTAGLMDIDWLSPTDYPDLPIIGKAQDSNGDFKGVFKNPDGRRTKPFRMHVRQGFKRNDNFPVVSWEWKEEPRRNTYFFGGYIRTWPAWDHLLTGLSVEARKKTAKNDKQKITTPFDGSLYEGLDIKASMRSYIRGEDRIYVKDARLIDSRALEKMFDFVPTVILFDTRDSEAAR